MKKWIIPLIIVMGLVLIITSYSTAQEEINIERIEGIQLIDGDPGAFHYRRGDVELTIMFREPNLLMDQRISLSNNPRLKIVENDDGSIKIGFDFELPKKNYVVDMIMISNKDIIPSLIENFGKHELFFIKELTFEYKDIIRSNFESEEILKKKELRIRMSGFDENYEIEDMINVDPTLAVHQLNITYNWKFNNIRSGILIKPLSNYSDSLWMIDFGLIGSGVTDYDSSVCGANGTLGTTIPSYMNSSKKGSYALSYGAQNSATGRSEKMRFGIRNFPIRFETNISRIFFEINQTLAEYNVTRIDLNITRILNNTGISINANSTTFRLYRVSRNGGIYNDTGVCLEQPVTILN